MCFSGPSNQSISQSVSPLGFDSKPLKRAACLASNPEPSEKRRRADRSLAASRYSSGPRIYSVVESVQLSWLRTKRSEAQTSSGWSRPVHVMLPEGHLKRDCPPVAAFASTRWRLVSKVLEARSRSIEGNWLKGVRLSKIESLMLSKG